MPTPFDTISYDMQDEATSFTGEGQGTANEPSSASLDLASIDNLNLGSESLEGFDPNADAYDMPPPPPDGLWMAKLKRLKVKDEKGGETDFTAVKNSPGDYRSAVEVRLIDISGKFDNVPMFDYTMSTKSRKNGGIPMFTLIQAVAKSSNNSALMAWRPRTKPELLKKFAEVLASEPTVGVESAWEAQCEVCQKEAKDKTEAARLKDPNADPIYSPRASTVKGMHRFPQLANGTHRPEVTCPVEAKHGAIGPAQARVVRYVPSQEVKK